MTNKKKPNDKTGNGENNYEVLTDGEDITEDRLLFQLNELLGIKQEESKDEWNKIYAKSKKALDEEKMKNPGEQD